MLLIFEVDFFDVGICSYEFFKKVKHCLNI